MRTCYLGDLALVCPDVYKTLLKLKQIVKEKKEIFANAALSDDAKVASIRTLGMRVRLRAHTT